MEKAKSQEKTIKTCTRVKVTTLLYFIPINRASSLSTLIAVVVSNDTLQNAKPVTRSRKPE